MKNLRLPFVAMMMTWMAIPAFGAVVQTVSESFVGSAVTIPGVQGSAERIGFFAPSSAGENRSLNASAIAICSRS